MPSREKQQYAVNLEKALKNWSKDTGISLEDLRVELDVDPRSWRDLLSGARIIESRKADLYAQLFRKTGLIQADPTAIPNRGGSVLVVRRWTYEQLTTWWQTRYPDECDMPEVKLLLSKTLGAKEAGVHFEIPDGAESLELIGFKDFLTDLMQGDKEFRDQFYRNNRTLLRKIIEMMNILNSNPQVREELLNLKGVVNE
mgnify:CR=1 FL=1